MIEREKERERFSAVSLRASLFIEHASRDRISFPNVRYTSRGLIYTCGTEHICFINLRILVLDKLYIIYIYIYIYIYIFTRIHEYSLFNQYQCITNVYIYVLYIIILYYYSITLTMSGKLLKYMYYKCIHL